MSTSLDLSQFGVTSEVEENSSNDTESEYIDEPPIISVMDLSISDSVQSPLVELEKIAMNSQLSSSERFSACKRIYQSPYLHKNTICIRILLHVLAEKTVTIEDRFSWLTQLKLSSDSIDVCLYGYVYWFYTYHQPMLYKLISAQFILTHPLIEYPFINTHVKYAQQWLYKFAKKDGEDIMLRSEAADILLRLGTPSFRMEAGRIINELGNRFLTSRERTIYNNTQNVHEIENIEQAIKEITNEPLLVTMDTILDWIQSTQNNSALSSFQRITLDTGLFHGFRMTELLCYVYQRIIKSPYEQELKKRFLEEMMDMNGWCGSGHVNRIINMLQGFDDSIQLTMPIHEEIKASVYARYSVHLKSCSKEVQEEIALCFCQEDKTLLVDFMDTYSSYDELKKEYSHIDERLFEEPYHNAIRKYSGM